MPDDLRTVAGDDQSLVLCRELTKLHEEILRGTVADVIARFASDEPRGEITIVLPAGPGAEAASGPDEEAIRSAAACLLKLGVGTKDAASILAELTGRARKEMYALVLELRE